MNRKLNLAANIIGCEIKFTNKQRLHQGTKHIPEGESIPAFGIIQKKSILWGLHHHYYRSSA